jgi:hypothetical protein
MRGETAIGEWYDAVQDAVEKKMGRKLLEQKCIASQ